jgi:hypothetical protein
MLKKALAIVVIYSLFGGCSNKLNILAPYKESVSVYGLLDTTDAISYIRVERVFLGAGNAYTMAQNPDSVYFTSGELTVSLQRWNLYTGAQVSVDVPASANMQIVLTDTLMQLEAGTFNQNARIYKTNHRLYAYDTNCVYKLIIQNNKTGKQYTAQTPMVADFQLIDVSGVDNAIGPAYGSGTSSNPLNIVPGNQGVVTCQYNSPVNAGVCSLTMRLFYTENDGGINNPKYVDLGLGTYYPSSTVGGLNQTFDYLGTSLLSYIAAAIPVPARPSITRTADSVEFLLIAGGPNLALYNQVNAATPLSQNVPNYTNISGGIGVFSSRYQKSIGRILSSSFNQACLDTLAGSSITCKLQFLNYNGTLVPCQ